MTVIFFYLASIERYIYTSSFSTISGKFPSSFNFTSILRPRIAVAAVSFARPTVRESLYISTRRTVNSVGNFVTTWRGLESLVIEGARANRLARAHARDAGLSASEGPTSCCSSNRSKSSRLLYQTHKSRLYCCYMLSRTNPRTGYDDVSGKPRKNNARLRR